ncbi:MAG: uroporphyrinogen-III synthase, partial [Betaproteobacteria bacterium]|nr:uroporphyrinogen-III synthase [Betaproteobacteria bacterium]
LKEFAARPQNFDLAIFVSEEAVYRLQKLPPAKGAPLPALAVGPATLKTLAKIPGFAAEDAPAGDGEALLKLPQLRAVNIENKKIAVLGGIDGGGLDSLSPQLCRALRNRGAAVFPIAAYRRLPPSASDIAAAAEIAQLVANRTLRAAVAYSGETAAAMLKMVAPNAALIKRLPLFVIHPRIAAAAKKMGYENVRCAPAAAAEMVRQIAQDLQAGGE